MLAEGITPIGDGLLDVAEEHLKGLLVTDDINEIYDVEQTPFARGKFAAVRRAIHKRSGVHFAAKFLKRRRRAQSSDKEIKHEIAVLILCNDADNIVKLNAVHESRSDTALLLELATGGELQTLLDNEECLTEAQTRICMREVLKALQFLHKRSIVHLDLKPQNILLVGEHIEDGLKLCDFGISRIVAEGTNIREIVGTPDYVAPEVLQYEPLSLLTDIWSVGVLTYVLLSGFSPFGGETKQETFLNISQCSLTFPDKLFGGVSTAAIDFIRKTLRIKPNDRMTAAGCLEHIWLKDECSIDRHLFNNITKQQHKQQLKQNGTNGHADDYDYDDDNDYGDDDDDADDDQIVDDDDNDNINDLIHNGGKEIITNRPERIIQTSQIMANSLIAEDCCTVNFTSSTSSHIINGTNYCANIDSDACDGNKDEVTIAALPIVANGISGAGITATAGSITSPPLSNNEQLMEEPNEEEQQKQKQQQQQQMLHTMIMRCHSTESNKENTYIKEKKSSISIGIGGIEGDGSNATNLTSTSPLIINGDEKGNNVHTATMTTTNSAIQVLFPDAPTTPKVIRKAPINDNSPTSVKALVKKFQLERDHDHDHDHHRQHVTAGAESTNETVGGGRGSVDVTVKINQSNGVGVGMGAGGGGRGGGGGGSERINYKKKTSSVMNGDGNTSSTSSQFSESSLKMKLTNSQKLQQQPQQQKYKPQQRQSLNPATTLSSTITLTNSSSRRASEPSYGIHPINRKLQITSSAAPISSSSSSMSTSTTSAANLGSASVGVGSGVGVGVGSNHYKTTCAYCLTSNNHNNRIINTTTATTTTTTTTTINGCRHSSSSSLISNTSTSTLVVSNVGGNANHTKRTTTMHLNSLNGINQNNTKCILHGNRERYNGNSNSNSHNSTIPNSSATSASSATSSTPSPLLFSSHQRLMNSSHTVAAATTTRSHQHHNHNHNQHHHHNHHRHHHHHHHHHHHNMMKNGNGASGNGLSLDQGIIC